MDEVGPGITGGGVYCRVPHVGAENQAAVDAQERACRIAAAAAGLTVSAEHVFIDTRRSAWQRGAQRPGWNGLLAAIKTADVRHLVLHDAGALLAHRPDDALALAELCDELRVSLRNLDPAWRLADPADRDRYAAAAREAVAQTDAARRTARAAHELAAAGGQPHGGGRRPYGYRPGMTAPIPAEADVVREMVTRYLGGTTLRAIATDLNLRGVPSTTGSTWTAGGVGRIIVAPRYAGLRVFRGEVLRDPAGGYLFGRWEPLISVAEWELACAVRSDRAAATGARGPQFYPLSGILGCALCGRAMAGSVVGDYRMYACSSSSASVTGRCANHIGAATLERRVEEAALSVLEDWDADRATGLPVAVRRQHRTIAERGRRTRDGRGTDGRSEGRAEGRTGNRPETRAAGQRDAGSRDVPESPRAFGVRSPGALDGVDTGPTARRGWTTLSGTHRAAVLRFLFAEIRIGPKTTQRGVFDDSRIRITMNEL